MFTGYYSFMLYFQTCLHMYLFSIVSYRHFFDRIYAVVDIDLLVRKESNQYDLQILPKNIVIDNHMAV